MGKAKEIPGSNLEIFDAYRQVRSRTVDICAVLEAEDCVIQSMDDVSPPKWHLAHTTWFFEEALLKPAWPGYEPYDSRYAYLFNSYYESLGSRHPRPHRGLLSRPTLREVLAYRQVIDEKVEKVLLQISNGEGWIFDRLALGLAHEEQHQELLLMDIKHIFAQNPLHPAYRPAVHAVTQLPRPCEWISLEGGPVKIGFEDKGFSFDNERPRHAAVLRPYEMADRLVTNAEFLEFIDEGGYEDARFWLSDGFQTVKRAGWQAPLYWERQDGQWKEFTLGGMKNLDLSLPVSHVSFFEADAYARYRGSRLPTEVEWEVAASCENLDGNFLESEIYRPLAASKDERQFYGDLWEWTASAYLPYPGFRPEEDFLREYNGKFMCNQWVLRGGSFATPQRHIRTTYRNFFYPHQRWAFGGIRLARDCR